MLKIHTNDNLKDVTTKSILTSLYVVDPQSYGLLKAYKSRPKWEIVNMCKVTLGESQTLFPIIFLVLILVYCTKLKIAIGAIIRISELAKLLHYI